MKKVKINKKDYNVKYTVRSLFLYEQITKKPFSLEELEYVMNRYIFAYCVILASNLDDVLEWDDFVAACDSDNTILESINKIILDEQKVNSMINNGDDSDDSKKD